MAAVIPHIAVVLKPPTTFPLHRAGKQFGVLMFIDIFLLFLPMARGSVLEDSTGLSHEDMLRYHKCVGGCELK